MLSASQANASKVIGVLCIMPYFVGVVFLTYFGGSSLESALVFAVMGIFALVAAIMAFQNNIRPFKWWDGKFDKHDLKWIGIGYAGILAASFVVTPLLGGGSIAILVALAGGGAMLFYSLKKSESLLVPWFVHSLYNFSALALASMSIITLAASPIYVPNFTFEQGKPADIASQFILQFVFVAFSEEVLKVSMALGVYTYTGSKNMSLAVSVAAWVALHTIVAYRVTLPF